MKASDLWCLIITIIRMWCYHHCAALGELLCAASSGHTLTPDKYLRWMQRNVGTQTVMLFSDLKLKASLWVGAEPRLTGIPPLQRVSRLLGCPSGRWTGPDMHRDCKHDANEHVITPKTHSNTSFLILTVPVVQQYYNVSFPITLYIYFTSFT